MAIWTVCEVAMARNWPFGETESWRICSLTGARSIYYTYVSRLVELRAMILLCMIALALDCSLSDWSPVFASSPNHP